MRNNITQRGQTKRIHSIPSMIKRMVSVALMCSVLFSITPYMVVAQETGPIFTDNFDGTFKADPFCKTGKCDTPAGWGVWFIPRRETDQPGINFQPTYTQIDTANRVRSGGSQRVYTENATHTGGIYRFVTDVKIGAKLRFSAWGQAWSTNDESPISARPSTDIRLKIGIDPIGGNNGQASPLNGQVVWSEEKDAKDAFAQFSVETEAKTGTVIVYLYATMKDPVRHNEVFWDDALLEYTAPAPTPTISVTQVAGEVISPTAAASSEVTATVAEATLVVAPQATSAVTYTVVAGDTLFGIALKFDKSVEELRRLNAMKDDSLSIGQVLVITAAVEPEAPAQEATAAPTAASVITATALPSTGALCVQAYFDNDGNGMRGQGEDLIPNILFNITTKSQTINSYTTDGVNEPYCIGNLAVAAYTVAATIMPAYQPTTPLNDTINVPGGAAAQFSVGLRRVSDGNQVVGGTDTPTPKGDTGGNLNVLALLATIGGGILILGTIGFGVLFFMQNRRM